jgi:hypothetical protein
MAKRRITERSEKILFLHERIIRGLPIGLKHFGGVFDTSLVVDERSGEHPPLFKEHSKEHRCCLILGVNDWWFPEILDENPDPQIHERAFVGPEDILSERGMWTEPHEVTANPEDLLNDMIDIRNGNSPCQGELLLEPGLIDSGSVWSPEPVVRKTRTTFPQTHEFHPHSSFSVERVSGKTRTTKMRVQKARANHQW